MSDSSTGPRCDRCGATAHTTYTRGTSTFQWCDHHARQHHAALVGLGYVRRSLSLPDVPDVERRAITGS